MSTAPLPPPTAPSMISPHALSSMLQAFAGLRNLRAAAAMLGCLLLAVIVFVTSVTLIGGTLVPVLASLLALLLVYGGVHAAGVLLMEQARQQPMRPLRAAIGYGIVCVPKTIALLIAFGAAALAVYVLLALLIFVCKLPWLGPLLFAVVFPLSIVVAGFLFTALWIGLMITLAAIWDGASVTAALAKALAVLHKRLAETLVLFVLLGLLSGVLMAFVVGMLVWGVMPTMGLSIGILDVDPAGVGMMFGGFGGGGDFGGGDFGRGGRGDMGRMGSYLVAAGFGGGFLAALVATLLAQVTLMGVNLIYLQVTEGLDASATQDALQAGLAKARERAAEAGRAARESAERMKAQAEQMRAQAQQAHAQRSAARTAAAAPPGAASDADDETTQVVPPACPACAAAVGRDDVFCGACGQRLHG